MWPLTMKNKFSIFSLLLILPLLASCAEKQSYVVYFGHHNEERTSDEIEEFHHSYLSSVKETEEEAKSSLLYSYKNSINGFAALLTPDEASRLSERDEVVKVIKSIPGQYSLHTTRSWEFSGLDEGRQTERISRDDLLFKAKYGKDVIVGMFDSGVWSESESFNDAGMGPVPKSWKGACQTGDHFHRSNCNKKLIGARYYVKAYEAHYGPLNQTLDCKSPRDWDGHGTHTASTVGGRMVPNAEAIGGFARGTASGGAPQVRLAIYKVCWAVPNKGKEAGNTCFFEDLLAAIDEAIGDGVHVMSMSLGSSSPINYTNDGLAIGALHATRHNIVTVCSAGNSGPGPSTLANAAPWIFTVGASSLDRSFVAQLQLGNGLTVKGETVTPYKLARRKMYPLVYAAQVVNADVPKTYIAGQCLDGSLSPEKAKGKIVFCMRGNGTRVGKGMEVKRAGGVGYILGNSPANGAELPADAHVLPATAVTSDDAVKILKYINLTKNPTAYIFPAKTVTHTKPAPSMTSFSSRGPNVISPDILKPDITAPGLNILAAWTGADSPSKIGSDHRLVKYNIISGTSMSCPHVTAAVALLKAIHPDWSPAAIKSAIMTSAGLENNEGKLISDASGKPADPFQFGAGHFRPEKAADPGLVYNASYTDYLLFLCSTGSGGVQDLEALDPSFRCPKEIPRPYNLNYPSFTFPKLKGKVTVRRSVTNVGGSKSIYFASVKAPLGISVKVSPPILYFDSVGQKKSFKVVVVVVEAERDMIENGSKYSFGWLTWSDSIHTVRSPIAAALA